MVLAAAQACEDKKAEDTRILELDAADAGFTDFFLITSDRTSGRPRPSPTKSKSA